MVVVYLKALKASERFTYIARETYDLLEKRRNELR